MRADGLDALPRSTWRLQLGLVAPAEPIPMPLPVEECPLVGGRHSAGLPHPKPRHRADRIGT
eukprot:3342735-Heterocapsa_arctica.AAC.1